MGSTSYEKDNPLTRAMNLAQGLNTGRPAGKSGPILLGDGPSVKSAAVGREIVPPPLSPEEVRARDKEAIKLGIMSAEDGEENKYGSLDEAMSAGKPIERPGPSSPVISSFLREPTPRGDGHERVVRLPNFKRIYGYDLIEGVVVVDDIKFQLTEADIRGLKAHAVEIAMDAVAQQLAAAWKEFGTPPQYTDETAIKVWELMNDRIDAAGEGTQEVETAELAGGTQSLSKVDSGDSNKVAESGTDNRRVENVVVNPIGQANTV